MPSTDEDSDCKSERNMQFCIREISNSDDIIDDQLVTDPQLQQDINSKSNSFSELHVDVPNVFDLNNLQDLQVTEKNSVNKITKRVRDKHFCIFCHTFVTNFARHISRMHPGEPEVQQLQSKERNSLERKNLINLIRNKGNFLRNGEELCTKPVRKFKTTMAKSFLPCTYCYGFFSKHLLWKHKKRCPQNNNNAVSNQALSQNMFLKNLQVDKLLQTEVFPRMRADHVSLIAKKDILICAFGARYLKTHREKHFIHVTSRKMRELSKLLIEVRKLTSDVSNLFDALKPQFYDILVQATKTVAKYSAEKNCFQSPTYAINMGTTIKDCCNIAITFALQRKNIYQTIPAAEAESNLKSLIHLIQSNWQFDVSSQAISDLSVKKWNKITIIPFASDLKIFKNFLSNRANESAGSLSKNNKNFNSYRILMETVFCRVLLLNRKRPGELQRLLISNYKNVENRQSYEEFSDVVTPTEKILMKKFKRVVIRGKRGRGVPVLFSDEVQENIDLLLSVRENFFGEINNLYLFGLPSNSANTTIIGYKVMKKYASMCKLKNPHAITATRLRKHLATITQIFSMTEGDIEQLATFMGHTDRIHRGEYRLPDDVYQTAKICKILLSMESGTAANFKGKTLDEIEINMEEDLIEEDNFEERDVLEEVENITDAENDMVDNSFPSNEKTASKKKRVLVSWTEEQKTAVKEFFYQHIKSKKPPKKAECMELLAQYPEVLHNKNWLKIKVFVQNIYTKKSNYK